MTKKMPDCVDLKHKGAERIFRMLNGMSLEEQTAFWQQRTRDLREHQKSVRRKPPVNKHEK